MNFETEWLDDARRYYTNIVGKYGTQVQALLKKAATIEIETICPLHGPVWRKDIGWFIDKYVHWSNLQARGAGRRDRLRLRLRQHRKRREHSGHPNWPISGVRDVKMYDVSATHPSFIVSECFRASHLVFALHHL